MNIRVHKKVNGNHVTLGKESLVNTFYGLVELYNKQDTYKSLDINKQNIWELAGYSGKYDSNYVRDLIQELVKSKPFDISSLNKVGIKSISGSMFIVTEYTEGGKLKIEVPEAYRQLLFYKKDLDLMTKAKKKVKMSVEELDHWDKETKEKSKFLVLLKKADLLHIQGKYNKRLYALLMQWSYTGSYEVKYKNFKEILEIPQSYRASNIDQQVFTPAKKELLKVGLKITRITKKKEGRSITGIKINFKLVEENGKEEKIVNPNKNAGVESNVKRLESLTSGLIKPKIKEVELTEEQIQEAVKKCILTEGIDKEILENMRRKSKTIFINTIKKYIEV